MRYYLNKHNFKLGNNIKVLIFKTYIVITALLLSKLINAQTTYFRDTTLNGSLITIGFGYHFPGQDLANRFGNNASIELGLTEKLRDNWLIRANGSFLFSDKVRENNILKNITNSNDFITNVNGMPGDIRIAMRGFNLNLSAGKIWGQKNNQNAGLTTLFGLGFLQHKIHINVINNDIPQLEKQYLKGYDRLSNGALLSQYIGYTYLSPKDLVNFYVGLEFIQAFTKNRRDINFDTMMKDETPRLDLLFGIKAGWIIPIYHQPSQIEYYD